MHMSINYSYHEALFFLGESVTSLQLGAVQIADWNTHHTRKDGPIWEDYPGLQARLVSAGIRVSPLTSVDNRSGKIICAPLRVDFKKVLEDADGSGFNVLGMIVEAPERQEADFSQMEGF